MVQASRLKIHDIIVLNDTIYKIIKTQIGKRQKHGFRKIEFTSQSEQGIRIYVCSCVEEIALVDWDIKDPGFD
jgi:hypothetical protein